MSELTEFQRCQLVRDHMASIRKVVEVFGVSLGTVSKIMPACRKTGKLHLTNLRGIGNVCCLIEPDVHCIPLIPRVLIKIKNLLLQKYCCTEYPLTNYVSTKTVLRELHKQGGPTPYKSSYIVFGRCFHVFVNPLYI